MAAWQRGQVQLSYFVCLDFICLGDRGSGPRGRVAGRPPGGSSSRGQAPGDAVAKRHRHPTWRRVREAVTLLVAVADAAARLIRALYPH
jgi:hypothetical protein